MWTWAWTAIWAVLAFVLLLVHGDAILTFAAEQLDQRRAHRPQLEQERTKQALIVTKRDALVWRELSGSHADRQAVRNAARITPDADVVVPPPWHRR